MLRPGVYLLLGTTAAPGREETYREGPFVKKPKTPGITVPMIPSAWSVNDVLHHIPESWRHARICVVNSIGQAEPVRRVVLTVNNDGTMVVMLGEDIQEIGR